MTCILHQLARHRDILLTLVMQPAKHDLLKHQILLLDKVMSAFRESYSACAYLVFSPEHLIKGISMKVDSHRRPKIKLFKGKRKVLLPSFKVMIYVQQLDSGF